MLTPLRVCDASIFRVLQRYEHMVELVGEICHEKGLDVQNYQCRGCSRPVGMCQCHLRGRLISLQSHNKRVVNVQAGGCPAATMFRKYKSTR